MKDNSDREFYLHRHTISSLKVRHSTSSYCIKPTRIRSSQILCRLLEAKGLYTLNQVYDKNKDDIGYFVRLYRVAKVARMSVEQVGSLPEI